MTSPYGTGTYGTGVYSATDLFGAPYGSGPYGAGSYGGSPTGPGEPGPAAGGYLADVETLRRRTAPLNDSVLTADLVAYLQAADEVVESIVGPIRARLPVPSAWREAALIIAAHLAERWAGSSPTRYGTGSDENGVYGRGFAIPTAARELLQSTLETVTTGQPLFAFPPASDSLIGGYGYARGGLW